MVLSVECREFVKSDLLTQVIPIIHDGVNHTNLITNIINFLVSEFLVQISKLFLQEKIIIFLKYLKDRLEYEKSFLQQFD